MVDPFCNGLENSFILPAVHPHDYSLLYTTNKDGVLKHESSGLVDC